MYRYLPIHEAAAISANQRGANSVYVRRTRRNYDDIIRWWFLCALVKECIAPTAQLSCSWRGNRRYAGCHRFDQSALNILLVNVFPNDSLVYYSTNVSGVTVRRYSQGREKIFLCQSPGGRRLPGDGQLPGGSRPPGGVARRVDSNEFFSEN